MSMSTGGGGRSNVKAEPNVTPMIDVMLVLLIIFMLVIPAINAGFVAQPPMGQNLRPHPEEDDDQVLGIDVNGEYYLNKKHIRQSDLAPELNRIYTARTVDKVLFIKADKNLDYGKVVDAMDIAAHNLVTVTAMITDQRPGTMSVVAEDRLGLGGKK
ncbi:MAG: biopolymer transporter ExbD [Gemmatimonadaceae bacterium]|nr:biopolymer transporter ExbD [Gemmatimonadaceae bacterium]